MASLFGIDLCDRRVVWASAEAKRSTSRCRAGANTRLRHLRDRVDVVAADIAQPAALWGPTHLLRQSGRPARARHIPRVSLIKQCAPAVQPLGSQFNISKCFDRVSGLRFTAMTWSTVAKAAVVPLTALLLSACVSQSSYDTLQAQNQQLQAQTQQLQEQNQQLQAQVANLQKEASFVEAGDLLFPAGGYQLSPAGRAELSSNIVPKLTGLQNAKVVVYGYTDDAPVGRRLRGAGINDNLTLSSRRAGEVVTYLVSQGVNPNIISAKGFGDTHPVAPNDTPADRAKNRRIVITVQGPGASSA